jgi:DNA-binding MarR family transcriptional regulator
MWAENAGSPLSPGRLSQRIGLTSGATNALITRLERRGLVSRLREHEDRRIVTLRATEHGHRETAPHVARSRAALEAATADVDPRTLAAIERFVDDILPVMLEPADPPRPAPAGTGGRVPPHRGSTTPRSTGTEPHEPPAAAG